MMLEPKLPPSETKLTRLLGALEDAVDEMVSLRYEEDLKPAASTIVAAVRTALEVLEDPATGDPLSVHLGWAVSAMEAMERAEQGQPFLLEEGMELEDAEMVAAALRHLTGEREEIQG